MREEVGPWSLLRLACLSHPLPQPWLPVLQPLPWTVPPSPPQPSRVKEGETPGSLPPPVPPLPPHMPECWCCLTTLLSVLGLGV